MQHNSIDNLLNCNTQPIAMSGDQAAYNRASGSDRHDYNQHRRHPNGSVSPLPPPPREEESPLAHVAKQQHHQQQQQQQLLPPSQHQFMQPQSPSLLYAGTPQGRAFSTSQPGSPTTYKVSPITRENSNDAAAFNPQSPYRSMAPSQSRFFDSSTLTSPNDQLNRDMRAEALTSSPRFKRTFASPQSSSSLHSPEVLRSSQPSLHQLHVIAAADSGVSHAGCTTEAGQTASTAESGFTAVLTNTNASSVTVATYSGSSTNAAAVSSPPSPGLRAHPSVHRSSDSWTSSQRLVEASHGRGAEPGSGRTCGTATAATTTTILPRRQPDNFSPTVNASFEGRLPPSLAPTSPENSPQLQSRPQQQHSGIAASSSSSAAVAAQQQRERSSQSPPMPPPHASVVAATTPSPRRRECTPLTEPTPSPATAAAAALPGNSPCTTTTTTTRTSESAGRWVSPQRPHRAPSADTSDGFQSPGSVPSSCDTTNTNASATVSGPAQTATRSPAMYGVIGLPCGRGDASPGSAVSSGRATHATATGAHQAVASPVFQFHPIPTSSSSSPLATSSSRAPTIVKLRSPPAQQQQQQQPSHAAGAGSGGHVDPTYVGAAPVAAHPRSGSSEFSARYRRSIARNSARNGTAAAAVPRENSVNDSCDTSQAELGSAPAAQVAGGRTSQAGTPPAAPPRESHSGASFADGERERDGEEAAQTEPKPQHITSVAPAAVVAARARAPVSSAAPTAVAAGAVVDAMRRPERRQTNIQIIGGNINAGGSPPPASAPPSTQQQQQQQHKLLTADTVLPVAPQEEEEVYSSSTTNTTERSSSSSRRHGTTPSPASSKSSAKTGASPQSSGRGHTRLAQTTSDLSNTVARQRERTRQLHQQPQQQRKSPLSATYSGGTSSPTTGRVAALSTSAERTRRTGSGSGQRPGSVSATSVSSNKSTAPALAAYSFVASRAHLQRYIDQWRDRFEEDKSAYKEGGYLTVTPGKIVHSRYVLIQKLGWGEFSTVWLAYDTKHATMGRGATQAFVAVKVAKCRASVQEATHYEVSLLRYIEARLPPHAAVTNIIDCFEVQGEFGLHTCMVMPLCGPNLLSIIDRMKGQRGRRNADDVRLVKEIIISVLLSLHELSLLNVVHTDIKPENVLCCAVDSKLVASMEKFCSYNKDRSHMISVETFRDAVAQQTSDHLVCLADFGLSALLEPPGSAAAWTSTCPSLQPSLLTPLMRCKKNFNVTKSGIMDNLRGTLIQTREYRAPEVLLGLDFTCATDVWSVGCMAFELITGNFLMDPKKKTRDAREMDIEHLAMMMQLIGPLPSDITNLRVQNNDHYDAVAEGSSMQRRSTRPPPEYLHRFVDRDGNFIYASRYRSYPRRSLETELEPYLGFREARLAANFILSCLCTYDPKNRPSAKKLLAHPWFQGMGTSSKERTGFR